MVISRSDAKRRRKEDDGLEDSLQGSPKRTKVHAQRKFAQGSSNLSSPALTPVKDKDKVKTNGTVLSPELIPSKRPKTEDFLTFLCFRGTPILPPQLDFFNVATVQDSHDEEQGSSQGDCSNSKTASMASASHKSQRSTSIEQPTTSGMAKKSEKVVSDPKKKPTTAVQAIKKKYQEQRLAKQRATTLTKLAQKVKGKNMVRTRSSAVHEESRPLNLQKIKPKKHIIKKEVRIIKKLKPLKYMQLRRMSARGKRKPGRDVQHHPIRRGGLRSGGQLPPGSEEGLKNDKGQQPKPPVKEKRVVSDNSKSKVFVSSLSDFSSDDDQPLVKRSRPVETSSKQQLARKVVKRVMKSSRKLRPHMVTRSKQQQAAPTVTRVSSRPTRKTKEAAALYMELLGKKLISPDLEADEDSLSIDSFPELPNSRRNEQRENELKARLSKEKKDLKLQRKEIQNVKKDVKKDVQIQKSELSIQKKEENQHEKEESKVGLPSKQDPGKVQEIKGRLKKSTRTEEIKGRKCKEVDKSEAVVKGRVMKPRETEKLPEGRRRVIKSRETDEIKGRIQKLKETEDAKDKCSKTKESGKSEEVKGRLVKAKTTDKTEEAKGKGKEADVKTEERSKIIKSKEPDKFEEKGRSSKSKETEKGEEGKGRTLKSKEMEKVEELKGKAVKTKESDKVEEKGRLAKVKDSEKTEEVKGRNIKSKELEERAVKSREADKSEEVKGRKCKEAEKTEEVKGRSSRSKDIDKTEEVKVRVSKFKESDKVEELKGRITKTKDVEKTEELKARACKSKEIEKYEDVKGRVLKIKESDKSEEVKGRPMKSRETEKNEEKGKLLKSSKNVKESVNTSDRVSLRSPKKSQKEEDESIVSKVKETELGPFLRNKKKSEDEKGVETPLAPRRSLRRGSQQLSDSIRRRQADSSEEKFSDSDEEPLGKIALKSSTGCQKNTENVKEEKKTLKDPSVNIKNQDESDSIPKDGGGSVQGNVNVKNKVVKKSIRTSSQASSSTAPPEEIETTQPVLNEIKNVDSVKNCESLKPHQNVADSCLSDYNGDESNNDTDDDVASSSKSKSRIKKEDNGIKHLSNEGREILINRNPEMNVVSVLHADIQPVFENIGTSTDILLPENVKLPSSKLASFIDDEKQPVSKLSDVSINMSAGNKKKISASFIESEKKLISESEKTSTSSLSLSSENNKKSSSKSSLSSEVEKMTPGNELLSSDVEKKVCIKSSDHDEVSSNLSPSPVNERRSGNKLLLSPSECEKLSVSKSPSVSEKRFVSKLSPDRDKLTTSNLLLGNEKRSGSKLPSIELENTPSPENEKKSGNKLSFVNKLPLLHEKDISANSEKTPSVENEKKSLAENKKKLNPKVSSEMKKLESRSHENLETGNEKKLPALHENVSVSNVFSPVDHEKLLNKISKERECKTSTSVNEVLDSNVQSEPVKVDLNIPVDDKINSNTCLETEKEMMSSFKFSRDSDTKILKNLNKKKMCKSRSMNSHLTHKSPQSKEGSGHKFPMRRCGLESSSKKRSGSASKKTEAQKRSSLETELELQRRLSMVCLKESDVDSSPESVSEAVVKQGESEVEKHKRLIQKAKDEFELRILNSKKHEEEMNKKSTVQEEEKCKTPRSNIEKKEHTCSQVNPWAGKNSQVVGSGASVEKGLFMTEIGKRLHSASQQEIPLRIPCDPKSQSKSSELKQTSTFTLKDLSEDKEKNVSTVIERNICNQDREMTSRLTEVQLEKFDRSPGKKLYLQADTEMNYQRQSNTALLGETDLLLKQRTDVANAKGRVNERIEKWLSESCSGTSCSMIEKNNCKCGISMEEDILISEYSGEKLTSELEENSMKLAKVGHPLFLSDVTGEETYKPEKISALRLDDFKQTLVQNPENIMYGEQNIANVNRHSSSTISDSRQVQKSGHLNFVLSSLAQESINSSELCQKSSSWQKAQTYTSKNSSNLQEVMVVPAEHPAQQDISNEVPVGKDETVFSGKELEENYQILTINPSQEVETEQLYTGEDKEKSPAETIEGDLKTNKTETWAGSKPIQPPDRFAEKKSIFQQRRSFLHKAKERKDLIPSANAFSPENESSVYAFETEPESPPISTPFRRRARDSRTSSTTTSKSEEDLAKLGDEEINPPPVVPLPPPVEARTSTSIAVQVNLDSEPCVDASPQNAALQEGPTPEVPPQRSMECSTQTEGTEEDDDESEGHLFYIPLQQAPTPTQQLIQGVAVKLGTEGPTGPNQRVIMRAKLVTKAPNFNRAATSTQDGIRRSLGYQHQRAPSMLMMEQKSPYCSTVGACSSGTYPPVGTVQPTTRSRPSPQSKSDAMTETSHTVMKQFITPSFVKSSPNKWQNTVLKEKKVEADVQTPSTSSFSAMISPAKVPVAKTGVKERRSSVDHTTGKGAKRSLQKGKASRGSDPSYVCTPSNVTTFPVLDSHSQLVEAPTFHPTEKEFQDPLEFIDKIRPVAEKFGLCRVVPPSNFKPECKVTDDMRFTAYNQYVHQMLQRWGPNVKEMMAIKKYLATQSIPFTHPPWIGGMEVDLPRLYQTVQSVGGLKEVIEKKRWQRVADGMKIPKSAQDRVTKLDDIYCKYLLPYDTLSPDERQKLFDEVEKEWALRESRVSAQDSSSNSESPEDESDGDGMDETEECIVKGRNMPLNAFYRIARNTMSMWFRQPEPSATEVEQEFWRHVMTRNSHVCVHSGSIDSSGWGYGFPCSKNSPFAKHPWNLKVLTNNSGSVLRSIGPIMGVTVPTLHVGMLFATCCWYRDPHGLPWIEYLHTGANKIWYGIPDSYSSVFRSAMSKLVPRYCRKKTIWLPSDTAMVPPSLLVKHGVSLCHTVQEPGQFIVVFPRAFTSSICTGYLVSESVYFAQPSWLTRAEQVFKDIQGSCEPSMFSLERLLFSIAIDTRSHVDVLRQVLPMILGIRQQELDYRKQLYNLGLKTSERLPLPEANVKRRKLRPALEEECDYECEICRANLFVSLVTNSHEEGVYCLPHAIELLTKKKHHLKYCKLMYTYDQAELNELIQKLQDRIEVKSHKKSQNKHSVSAQK